MKNRLILSCFWVALHISFAFSQSDFAKIGTRWTYTQWVPGPNTAIVTRYPFYMEADSEVVFQGRLCRRLIGGRAGLPQLPLFYLYNQGDSVFRWDWSNNRFNLLYDFSAETGDSWEIEMPHGSLEGNDTTITVLVDSMSYQVINSDTFKVWHISYNEWADWSDILIEGIGSTCYLIPSPDVEEFDVCGLRCFEDELTNINFVNYPCDSIITPFVSNSEVPTDAGYITIYPNPATNEVMVEYPFWTGKVLLLQLYDIAGKKVYSERFNNKGTHTFDASGLSNGIYTLRLLHNNQVLKHVKLSILH